MSRMDQMADDVSELKVMVAKIATVQEHQQESIGAINKSIDSLNDRMSTALIPIQFAKWSIAVGGGLSVLVGLVYGVVQIAQAMAVSGGGN